MSTVDRVIEVAKNEVGYHEGRDADGNWNNKQKYSPAVPGLEWSDWQAWCATFVSWVALQSGVADLYPRTASCYTGVEWFKNAGRFSEYPAIGAQVFFGSGGGTHTGLVVNYDNDYIYTVEGNTNNTGSPQGDGVYTQKRARRDAYVYGYGYPKFSEGIKSADPAWADQTPKEQPKPSPVYAPFPGSSFFRLGKEHPLILAMGKALVREGYSGYSVGPSQKFERGDIKAYAWWQRKLGYSGSDADGYPGKSSWDKLKVPQV